LDNETSKNVKCHEFGLFSAARTDRADACRACFSPSTSANLVNTLTLRAGALFDSNLVSAFVSFSNYENGDCCVSIQALSREQCFDPPWNILYF
jgi:hypothetical protein